MVTLFSSWLVLPFGADAERNRQDGQILSLCVSVCVYAPLSPSRPHVVVFDVAYPRVPGKEETK